MKIAQFGTGNFLRAFLDWMVQKSNERFGRNAEIVLLQSTASNACERLEAAGCKWHVLLRGVSGGGNVETLEKVSCATKCLHLSRQWTMAEELFADPELACVFSNTTEAGIVFRKDDAETFPARLSRLLFARYKRGLGGVAVLPCELIENNGQTLLQCIKQYRPDAAFARWLERECSFCDTLVDRIVPGAPKSKEEQDAIAARFGVRDDLLVCAEPFHFLAIKGDERAKELLPFAECGLNVVWTEDIAPWRERKVRLLNGAHTGSVAAALLAGISEVGQMIADPLFRQFLRRLMFREILPTVPLPVESKHAFAESVLERFANPFIHHRLSDIALNSVAKWRTRNLPAMLDAGKPPLIVFSLAALIYLYTRETPPTPLRDDASVLAFFSTLKNKSPERIVADTLANENLWGVDLGKDSSLVYKITALFRAIDSSGIRATLECLLDESC